MPPTLPACDGSLLPSTRLCQGQVQNKKLFKYSPTLLQRAMNPRCPQCRAPLAQRGDTRGAAMGLGVVPSARTYHTYQDRSHGVGCLRQPRQRSTPRRTSRTNAPLLGWLVVICHSRAVYAPHTMTPARPARDGSRIPSARLCRLLKVSRMVTRGGPWLPILA